MPIPPERAEERGPVAADEYETAAVRVRERIGFYSHFVWYFWLNLLFFVVNELVTPEVPWWRWIALAWTVAIFLHLLSVFFLGDLRGPVKQRLLESELEQIRRSGMSPADGGGGAQTGKDVAGNGDVRGDRRGSRRRNPIPHDVEQGGSSES